MSVHHLSDAALSQRGPSCAVCSDWARGYAEGYAAGLAEGREAGRLEGVAEGPAHPAVVDSVARMFPEWDGADAAHSRSVAQFHEWHRTARAELEEVAA